MGGRPTGPIRSNPRWKTVFVEGELCYQHAVQDETIFYWPGSKTHEASSSREAGFVALYYEEEKDRCQEELRRWQDFRDTQQWRREHRPEKATEEETERQRYPQDPHLTASLKKVKDWKEYQVYFQRKIDRTTQHIERGRRVVEAIQRQDPEVVSDGGEDWLRRIEQVLEWLPAEEKRLEWAKQQLPAVLSECAASLRGRPTSRRLMEERSELEAKRVFNALVETGGRPTRPMRPVGDSRERKHAVQHLHVLCHWEGECSQFEEEFREWKKFLDYRQKKEADGKTEIQLEEQQPAEITTQVKLWKDYRSYQQLEVENAKQWVEFWQRQVENFEETENHCALHGSAGSAKRYHSMSEDAQSHVEEARKQVRPVKMRLEWVEQQFSAILAECAVSTTELPTSNHLEDQAKLPKRASRSGQTTLRSNRSEKSTLRSNHNKEKNRASANSAFGPIHSSRVSKVSGRKAPRLRRQSKILTTSLLLPTNIPPRRSSPLSHNEKRSGALETILAMDPGKSARSPPIILRRSDRISKQKERISTSTSNIAVNSAVIFQVDSLRHLSRSQTKGRLAGNKSDASSAVKPRGISKRQESKFSRNRNKIRREI